jgi:hypothetical protein
VICIRAWRIHILSLCGSEPCAHAKHQPKRILKWSTASACISAPCRAGSGDASSAICDAAGATVRYLPPYSRDYNPIEAAWALIKKDLRAVAP